MSVLSLAATALKQAFKHGGVVMLVVFMHSLNGIAPVLGRYLQTISKLPSLSINAISNYILFATLSPIVFVKYIRQRKSKAAQLMTLPPLPPTTLSTSPSIDLDTIGSNPAEVEASAAELENFESSPSDSNTLSTNVQGNMELNLQPVVHGKHVEEDDDDMQGQESAELVASQAALPATAAGEHSEPMHKQQLAMVIAVTTVVVIVFFFCRVGKSISNLYASKFTTSINTQLISLSTPFLVTFLTVVIETVSHFISKSQHQVIEVPTDGSSTPSASNKKLQLPINWKMIVAICGAVLGGLLVVLGKYSSKDYFTWGINFEAIFSQPAPSSSDEKLSLLGILISFTGYCMGAVHTIMLTYLTTPMTAATKASEAKKPVGFAKYNKFRMGGLDLVWIQALAVAVTCTIFSVIFQEDWSKYLHIGHVDWIMFVLYILLSYVIGEVVIGIGTAIAGSILTGSLMPTSLLWTTFFAFFILGELMNNLWQLLGCAVIIAASILFILFRYQLINSRKQSKTSS